MKLQVAILLGFAALASASTMAKLRQAPARSYGAPAPVQMEEKSEPEEPAASPAPVVYKSPVRHVERAPIRVSAYSKDEDEAPVRSAYGSRGYDEVAQEQAKSAQYSFASAVDDGIMDHSHLRQETRDGLKVTGTYAYSDGFFKRTVNYEADENGYRVVGENVEPISESGPQVDLVNGRAEVHTQIGGVDTSYSVHADELAVNSKKLKKDF